MTNILPLNVNVIKAIKALLDSQLATYVTATNAQLVSNGVNAEMPAQVLDYLPSVANLTQFPTIGIGEGPVGFEAGSDTGWTAIGAFDIAIILFLREGSGNRHDLAWKLRHTMAAVASCILHGRDVGAGWGVQLRSIEPGPILQPRDNAAPEAILGVRSMVIGIRDEQDDP